MAAQNWESKIWEEIWPTQLPTSLKSLPLMPANPSVTQLRREVPSETVKPKARDASCPYCL